MRTTVLLAEDHTVVREGLRMLLGGAPDVEVIAEAKNGREAVRMALELRPDVVLLDLMMPALSGVEAARQISTRAPRIKILILSSYTDAQQIRSLRQAGIAGYVVKQAAVEELLSAIRAAARGEQFFSKELAALEPEAAEEPAENSEVDRMPLSSREAEILQLVAEGHPNKQIAAELHISIKTVQQHRQRLMNKLNVHGIASLTRHAVARGIVDPVLPG